MVPQILSIREKKSIKDMHEFYRENVKTLWDHIEKALNKWKTI